MEFTRFIRINTDFCCYCFYIQILTIPCDIRTPWCTDFFYAMCIDPFTHFFFYFRFDGPLPTCPVWPPCSRHVGFLLLYVFAGLVFSSFDGSVDELELSLFNILFILSLSFRRRVFSFVSFSQRSLRAAFSCLKQEFSSQGVSFSLLMLATSPVSLSISFRFCFYSDSRLSTFSINSITTCRCLSGNRRP